MMNNKYNAKKQSYNGFVFDSKAEMRRYMDLELMQAAGLISNLEVHPKYDLRVNGILISSYKPDFRYCNRERFGALVVEDVKGGKATKTRDYVMRKKLMKALYNIDVVEIG